MKKQYAFAFAFVLMGGMTAFAGEAAAPYDNSRIDARLNVTVKDGTEVVHFVRDNADPNVITKAYEIKNTDPYELRSYIRKMVQTRKVDENNTNVEAVKYADGSALLLISAEDYRFEDKEGVQGFDSIVRELDKPGLVSGSGRQTYVYSPRFRSSGELLEMVRNVGAYSAGEAMNNVGGNDVLVEDPGLNLIFFNTAPFSRKNIMELLKKYDREEPAIRAKVTVYELYAENDTKLGLDFQAWKNNEGIDLLSAGGRFARNSSSAGLVRNADWNKVTYFQFNPKWNTRYVDFLTSKGKAKVLHTSELTLANHAVGKIEKYTQHFVAKGTPTDEKSLTLAGNVFSVTPEDVIGVTAKGKKVSVSAETEISVSKIGGKAGGMCVLRIQGGKEAFFTVDGANSGRKIKVARFDETFESELVSRNILPGTGGTVSLDPTDRFGFFIQLRPSINSDATRLKVQINNTSLMGYNSDGSPRIQKDAGIDTEFLIGNSGTKLVIGGIEKRSVMRVSGGIPFLKDLPLFGWLFSTETESTKRSQLLVVAEVLPAAHAGNAEGIKKEIGRELEKAGVSNSFGYRQYLLDSKR